MKKLRILVVGAGITGSVVARRLDQSGRVNVDVVEREAHVSGNLYDPHDENGVRIHQHGPHIFHTNSRRVQEFLSVFTVWRSYTHRVLGNIDGLLVPIPFNFQTLELLEPTRAPMLIRHLSKLYQPNEGVPVLRLMKSQDSKSRYVGSLAYEVIFAGYTRKQWGSDPADLSPSVTGRIPIRMGYDDRYFQDVFQGVPIPGYKELIEGLLQSKGITVSLGSEASKRDFSQYAHVVYTGAIDQLCDFRLGQLPYRSLRFDYTALELQAFQSRAQINYPGNESWTRIVEFKHLTGQSSAWTTIAREFPEPYVAGHNKPYYPIPDPSSRDLYKAYLHMSKRLFPNVVLAGRLGDYKYLNMDQAAAQGLSIAEGILREEGLT